jgi:hypothetical protein
MARSEQQDQGRHRAVSGKDRRRHLREAGGALRVHLGRQVLAVGDGPDGLVPCAPALFGLIAGAVGEPLQRVSKSGLASVLVSLNGVNSMMAGSTGFSPASSSASRTSR